MVVESEAGEDELMVRARHTELAFEIVIEAHLLSNGYVSVDRAGFDWQFSRSVARGIDGARPAATVGLHNLDRRGCRNWHVVFELVYWNRTRTVA